MLLQLVTVPLNVLMVLPRLASIRVKLAKQLQVAPLVSVTIALFVAWSEVNKTIEEKVEV